jgi:hypothetical protein
MSNYAIEPICVSVSVPLEKIRQECEQLILDVTGKKVPVHVEVEELKDEKGRTDIRVKVTFDDSLLTDDEALRLAARELRPSADYSNGDKIIEKIFDGIYPGEIVITGFTSAEQDLDEIAFITVEIPYESYQKVFGNK